MESASAQRIVLSGYYGFRNSGDEAVLKSILTALEEEGRRAGVRIEPVVLSADPEWTTKMYGVEAVPRMKLGEVRKAIRSSNGLISGGGSLLQDATGLASVPYYLGIIKLAQWMKKPAFVYAQGVGPVNRRMFHPLIASVFRKCAYVSVRDTESAELLHTMGLRKDAIEVVPDPVMGLPLPECSPLGEDGMAAVSQDGAQSSSELPVVGISVRFWNSERAELNALAEGLAALARQRQVHLRFLPFHLPTDEEASRYVMERIGDLSGTGSIVTIAQALDNPQEMLREVSRCSLIIGMRLHSLIYAASQRVPLLGISYDPKIDHFLARLGSVPVGTSEQLEPKTLAAQAQHLLGSGDEWRARQQDSIDMLKQEARIPARRIVDYLMSKG
ncbi:polysaccharide pyruvyl transferase CsaB [Paenibacillus sp. CAA11]|uniref:polysaccharide pyruvyl transferase CsaB n=1 Tax=Paenibacillus sp. CAA11 TaxID=1532905 RepID=UPI000D3A799D|nr:polysaccharide pyruvyl transferase CsaB [Paenibacillus sp. CAA11]AWB46258.1 polysaccharide pyruvyl transferase CsaB [Paenibacillus sp. CAA11]